MFQEQVKCQFNREIFKSYRRRAVLKKKGWKIKEVLERRGSWQRIGSLITNSARSPPGWRAPQFPLAKIPGHSTFLGISSRLLNMQNPLHIQKSMSDFVVDGSIFKNLDIFGQN